MEAIYYSNYLGGVIRDLIKSSAKFGVSIGANIFSMVVRTKILAVMLGTAGIGIYSLLMNVSSLLFVVTPFGSNGFTKYVAEYHANNKIREVNFIVRTIFFHNFPVILLLSVVLISAPQLFSKLLLSSESYWNLLLIFSFALPLGFISNLIDLYLRAIRSINLYVKTTVINIFISLLIFVPLVMLWGIRGAVITIGLSYVISIVVNYTFMKKYGVFPRFNETSSVDKSVLRKIYGMGFAMFVMLIVQQLTFLYIRTSIVNSLGIEQLGIYQSVFSISTNYFGLFFTIITNYAIPRLSSFGNNEQIIDEINRILKFFLFLYTPLLVICFVFRIYLISILYSHSFFEAQELFFFQLLGEFLKAISWVFGLWFIPTGLKIKQWSMFDIGNNIFYVALSYVLINYFYNGIKSISIAYMISYGLFAILQIYYIKKTIKFEFRFRSLYIFVMSFSTIMIIFLASQFNMNYGYYFIAPILTIWVFTTIRKSDVFQIKLLVRDVLKLRRIGA